MPVNIDRGEKGLTNREKEFCKYVVLWGNATRAAIKAGYSQKRGGQTAYDLLSRNDINEYIAVLKEQASKHQLEENVMSIAERRQFLTDMLMDEKTGKRDRLTALDILNKMDSAYTQKVDVTGSIETSQKFSDIVGQLGGKGLSENE